MYILTHTNIHLTRTGTIQLIINPNEESPLHGFHFLNFSTEGEVLVGVREGGRKACLSARAEREWVSGRQGGVAECRSRGLGWGGLSIMKFEICRTSKASVAQPLWQQRGGELLFFSLALSIPPFSAEKCLPRAG